MGRKNTPWYQRQDGGTGGENWRFYFRTFQMMLLPTVLLRCRILVVPAKKQLDNMRKPCSRLFHLIYPSDRGNVCNLISYSLILIKDICDRSASIRNGILRYKASRSC